jgi:sterol desaturase/sphingolipid hydroxylase (fatty acid hydroxylase superfamily)
LNVSSAPAVVDQRPPPERIGTLASGLANHLGPMLAYVGLVWWAGLDVSSSLWAFFLTILPYSAVLITIEMRYPAIPLRSWSTGGSVLQIVKLTLDSFVLGFLLVAGVWWLTSSLTARVAGPEWGLQGAWGVVPALVLLDFCYYWWHRVALHGTGKRTGFWRWIRKKHADHHAVEDLDLFRGNIFSVWDAFISHQLPLAVICGLLGMPLSATFLTFGLTMFGFSTHHVNHTFNLGPARWLFMDNHAHKLHHCRGGRAVNHGNFFSVWDRLFGTYYENWDTCATWMHTQGVALPTPLRHRGRGQVAG